MSIPEKNINANVINTITKKANMIEAIIEMLKPPAMLGRIE